MSAWVSAVKSQWIHHALSWLCAARAALRTIGNRLVPAELVVSEMATGALDAQVLTALSALGIANELVERGTATAIDLAARLGLQEGRVGRTLQFAATRGLVRRHRNDRFSATRLTQQLYNKQLANASHFARYFNGGGMHTAVLQLTEVLQSDVQAYDLAHNQDTWSYFSQNPKEASHFDAAMVAMSLRDAEQIAKAIDPRLARHFCDVGGGNGVVVSAVLRHHPDARATLVDQPHVIEQSKAFLRSRRCLDRTTMCGGNFFEDIPSHCSCYLLRNILHDWDDEQALRLLRRCRSSMDKDAVLLIVESIADSHTGFAELHSRMDMVMMIATPGGRQRDQRAMGSLLGQAGFSLMARKPLRSHYEMWVCQPTATQQCSKAGPLAS